MGETYRLIEPCSAKIKQPGAICHRAVLQEGKPVDKLWVTMCKGIGNHTEKLFKFDQAAIAEALPVIAFSI